MAVEGDATCDRMRARGLVERGAGRIETDALATGDGQSASVQVVDGSAGSVDCKLQAALGVVGAAVLGEGCGVGLADRFNPACRNRAAIQGEETQTGSTGADDQIVEPIGGGVAGIGAVVREGAAIGDRGSGHVERAAGEDVDVATPGQRAAAGDVDLAGLVAIAAGRGQRAARIVEDATMLRHRIGGQRSTGEVEDVVTVRQHAMTVDREVAHDRVGAAGLVEGRGAVTADRFGARYRQCAAGEVIDALAFVQAEQQCAFDQIGAAGLVEGGVVVRADDFIAERPQCAARQVVGAAAAGQVGQDQTVAGNEHTTGLVEDRRTAAWIEQAGAAEQG